MANRKFNAEAYLGRYLSQPSGHADISGLVTSERSVWSCSDIKTREESGLLVIDVNFGRNQVCYVYEPVSEQNTAHFSVVPEPLIDQPWMYRGYARRNI